MFSRIRAGAGAACVALIPFCIATLQARATERAAPELPSPLSLAWCLDRATQRNPAIALDDALRGAAAHRIIPAGALEDPRFRYEASNIPVDDFDFDSTPLSGHQLELSQHFPFPGVLSNRRAAAEAGAEAASFALTGRRLSVAAAVVSAWSELGFAQRALGITERNIALLRQLVQIAEAKYRVGSGLQQDVLRAQVVLTSLLDERLSQQAAIERSSARLLALLDLPADTQFPETEPLSEESAIPSIQHLQDTLETRSPELLALENRVEEATRLVRAAHFEGYPDFDVGVGYRVRKSVEGDPVKGDDFVGASLTLRLPVDRAKWNARVAERRALLRRAEAEYRGARASLRSDVRSAHAELVRADAEASLLGSGLVPQARQSLESSRSGYEVGRVDFLDLLDSQVRMLNAELRLVRAQADRRVAYAALEASAGETLR